MKCEVTKYDVKMQSYGPADIAFGLTEFRKHLYPERMGNQTDDEQWLIIFYDSTDVIHYQRIPILSIWSFVSSAGGSLGLFLGFSGYSVLSYFIDYMKGKFDSSSRVYMIRQEGLEPGAQNENGDIPTVAKNCERT